MADDALLSLLKLNSPNNMNAVQSTYVPRTSRNNARVSGIRKFLGMAGQDDGSTSQADYEDAMGDVLGEQRGQMQAEAEARAIPERVRGEYGLASDRIRGSAAIEAAKVQADRYALQLQANAENQRLNREATNERAAAGRSATDARSAATRDATSGRQAANRNEVTARLYETGKAHAPRPAGEGFLSRWLTGDSQSTLDQREAQRLRSGGGAAPQANDEVSGIAAQYLQQFGHLDDNQLQQVIMQNESDATPDEIQALMNTIQQMRSR